MSIVGEASSHLIMNQFAAVDVGSNSFHMVIAREDANELTVIDREREMVRLAAGLDQCGKITPEASQRALDCLARFGQRLRGLDADNVRVVGTNALRKAKNAKQFIARAEQVLGFSIDIISGVEEARLIYLGVAKTLQGDRGRRLVVDIGGGSTEIIVADRSKTCFLESLDMGCVSTSEKFFTTGKYSPKRMRRAILNAQLQLEPCTAALQQLKPIDVIGTSGTARAIEHVVRENGWSDTGITQESLNILEKQIVDAGRLKNLSLIGLGPDRQPVFAGGVAVMLAIFKTLNLPFMRISEGSLREGVLQDLIGRARYEDRRSVSVIDIVQRHRIDHQHGTRVRNTSLALFDQIDDDILLPRERRLLGWAAQLHEIGLMIAHNQHHRHGGYLLENMDLPGFSRQEQTALSIMVRLHRRKIHLDLIENCLYVRPQALAIMTRLLRLGVLFNRGRLHDPLPLIKINLKSDQVIELSLPEEWLAQHPLTAADLAEEVDLLNTADLQLIIDPC